MTIREYLQKSQFNVADVTFIVQRAVKDENTPFYHDEYWTTPVRSVREWLEGEGFVDTHIVINADHPPIDVTGTWGNWYKMGRLRCVVVTTEEELIKHYGEKQGKDMVAFYKRTVS